MEAFSVDNSSTDFPRYNLLIGDGTFKPRISLSEERFFQPPLKMLQPCSAASRTILINITADELNAIYKGNVLHEVLGNKAYEMLKLVEEGLKEENLDVSEEVKHAIANLLALVAKKMAEVEI